MTSDYCHVAHEEIQASIALLANIKKLDEEGLRKATEGAVGLASVLGPEGGGLSGATRTMLLGLQGSYRGLKQFGIEIDTSRSKQEQFNQVLDAASALLPRARAELEMTGGQVSQLKKNWGELKEGVGAMILDFLNAKENIANLNDVIKALNKNTADMSGGLTYAALKAAITKQAFQGMRGELGPLAQAFNALQKETPNIPIDLQAMTDAYIKGKGPFEAYLTLIRQANEIIEKFKKGADTKPIFDLSAALAELGVKGTASLKDELSLAEKALAAMLATGKESPGVIEAMRKKIDDLQKALRGTTTTIELLDTAIDAMPWGKHRAEMNAVLDWLYTTTTLIEGQLPAVAGYSSALDEAARHVALVRRELERINAVPQTWTEKFAKAMSEVQKVVDASNAVTAQAQANREIAIENEYKKRLDAINANVKDEDARQKAIIALDAEYEIKKTSAKRAGAKQEKAIALAAATMSAAQAFNAALTMKPWSPFNFVLAAMTAALATVQVGLIAAQPIPLAKGGYFKQETVLAGRDADYRLHPDEIVSPVPMMRSIVREELTRLVPAMAGGSFTFSGNINFYTPDISRSGIRKMGEEFWAEMEFQAGRHGFELRGKR